MFTCMTAIDTQSQLESLAMSHAPPKVDVSCDSPRAEWSHPIHTLTSCGGARFWMMVREPGST